MDKPRSTLIAELKERLGWDFSEDQHLNEALTHSTFANEHPEEGPDNERLEFLGDAVLGLLVASLLYERPSAMGEGQMSQLRARVVSGEALTRLAQDMELGECIRLGQGQKAEGVGGRILANAYEAVAGAVFFDGGFDAVRSCYVDVFRRALDAAGVIVDYKTRLQERCHELDLPTPRYDIIDTDGPDHARVFTCEVSIANKAMGRGQGRSKKAAEQECAQHALEELGSLDVSKPK